jgi:hypothetical protein
MYIVVMVVIERVASTATLQETINSAQTKLTIFFSNNIIRHEMG